MQNISRNIAQPFLEIEKLKEDFLISMPKVEWWLLKYSSIYKDIEKSESEKHLFELEDGSVVRLPPLGETNKNERLICLYQALEEIADFHKYENYFKTQMTELENVKNDKVGLNKWLLRNEKLGSEKFVCFLIDYLDYDEDDKVEHLKVYVYQAKELDIFIDKADFKNTVAFLENYNDLYWTDEQTAEKTTGNRVGGSAIK